MVSWGGWDDAKEDTTKRSMHEEKMLDVEGTMLLGTLVCEGEGRHVQA